MDVRSAVLLTEGVISHLVFSTRGVNCDELRMGKDTGGNDAVEVGVYMVPQNIVGLYVGGKSAGRSVGELTISMTESYKNPRDLYPEGATGTIVALTGTLEIRGKFTARRCGFPVANDKRRNPR
jgi:hypothetical protein